MFKKKAKINPSTTDTLIGEGSVFEGKIKSEASIRIEGALYGDIECAGDVTIGENGSVRSNIAARNVILAGSVQGNVTAKEKVLITATGQLVGNSSSKALVIEEGGTFQGQSKMEGRPIDSGHSSGGGNGSGKKDFEPMHPPAHPTYKTPTAI